MQLHLDQHLIYLHTSNQVEGVSRLWTFKNYAISGSVTHPSQEHVYVRAYAEKVQVYIETDSHLGEKDIQKRKAHLVYTISSLGCLDYHCLVTQGLQEENQNMFTITQLHAESQHQCGSDQLVQTVKLGICHGASLVNMQQLLFPVKGACMYTKLWQERGIGLFWHFN